MLTLYLAALVFGLGLFAVQAFSGAHGDGAHGGSGGHAGDAAGTDMEIAGAHGPGDWASIVLSLRFYMFAAIAFGIVGAPVAWLGLASPLATLIAALLTGLLLGFFATQAWRALQRQTLSSGAEAAELVGQLGRVLVACEKGRPGKVRLRVRGQIIDCLATTDEPRLAAGAAVVVQELKGERVHVCAVPSELLPE
jgi:membrane protein implicated in regulation of membrane protease activity